MTRVSFVDQTSQMGGAEWSLLDIVRERQKSFEDRVVLFEEGDFAERLRDDSVDVRLCALAGTSAAVKRESKWWQQASALSAVWQQSTRLAKAIEGTDVIYANTMKAFVVSAIVSRRTGIPLIFHLRDILSPAHFSGMNRRLVRSMCRWLPLTVIANSEATAAELIKLVGKPIDVHVIYNGIDPTPFDRSIQSAELLRAKLRTEFELGEEKKVIGVFGRLAHWKGQHVAIEAIANHPDWHLFVVGKAMFGEDDYAASLKKLVKELRLIDRVHFLGFQSKIADIMQGCDLVLHTSVDPEPFGRVIVEAMLARRPIVAADAGGAAEIIDHGTNGWLTKPGDVSEIRNAIIVAMKETDESMLDLAMKSARSKYDLASRVNDIGHVIDAVVAESTYRKRS